MIRQEYRHSRSKSPIRQKVLEKQAARLTVLLGKSSTLFLVSGQEKNRRALRRLARRRLARCFTVVADWLLVDHPSRKDPSKAVVVAFLSRSCRMSRSEFFCSCQIRIFHDNSRQRKLHKNSRKCSTRHFYENEQDAKASSRHE